MRWSMILGPSCPFDVLICEKPENALDTVLC